MKIAKPFMGGHVRHRSTLLCAALALLSAGTAMAEPIDLPGSIADDSEWLTVHARPAHRRPVDAQSRELSEIALIAHRVSYAGLDLATQADVVKLRKQIAESAQKACEQLSALAPLGAIDLASCIRDAIRHATERADRVIAVAIVEHEFESAL
jgi:UrcA family protein